MKKIIPFVMCLSFLFLTNCEDQDDKLADCTQEAVAGLNISLTDAVTSEVITTDVVVTAVDGAYSEDLTLMPTYNVFSGAWEREGTYVITVTKPGYQTATSEPITVTKDICHVVPQQLSIALTPN